MNRTITLRLSLIPVCALLAAACATMPDQPPDAPLPPVQAPPPAMPLSLSPDQRQQAQAQAAQALEQALGPARGSPARLHSLLGFPEHPATRIERDLADEAVAAFADPGFVLQLVPGLSDALLARIQADPADAVAIVGRGIGSDLGFDRVDLAGQKTLLRVIGETYAAATPAECPALSPTSASADSAPTLYTVMDRLPTDEERAFAHVVVGSMHLPRRSPQPLNDQEHEQFKDAIQRYFSAQTQEVRDRYLQFYFSKSSPDACWVVAETAKAILSGDEETTALGLRVFAGGFATKAGGS